MFTDPSPKINDSDNALLFKIAQILNSSSGGGGAGVTTFNGRSGVVTLNSGDVTTALGFTPISQAAGDARWVLKTGDTMTGALAIGNGTLAVASAPYLNLSQTWNNAGVTFTGLLSNVTLTAAGSNSNLFNFQIDGVDRFNFTSGGSFRAVRQDASDSGLNLFLRKRGSDNRHRGFFWMGFGGFRHGCQHRQCGRRCMDWNQSWDSNQFQHHSDRLCVGRNCVDSVSKRKRRLF
jgi:hypothetical protein